MKKKSTILLTSILLLMSGFLFAQTANKTDFNSWLKTGWGINGSVGSNLFYGDVRIYNLWPAKKYNNERRYAGSVGLQKEINNYLDLRANVLLGNLAEPNAPIKVVLPLICTLMQKLQNTIQR